MLQRSLDTGATPLCSSAKRRACAPKTGEGSAEDQEQGNFHELDRIEGNGSSQLQVKEKWARLTDDDIEVIAGRRDQLVGRSRSAMDCQGRSPGGATLPTLPEPLPPKIGPRFHDARKSRGAGQSVK